MYIMIVGVSNDWNSSKHKNVKLFSNDDAAKKNLLGGENGITEEHRMHSQVINMSVSTFR